ncbi:M23 family metallopeptidase [Nocardioides marmoriginsengisoli]|uniref:M23 family metallopeptidase n=1 Tax=Nocardioides marmoriginsengisoli TaxID=661483 RepID=A0A3N0CKA6_9ACTN|nr:M23 family metallopeptidase [Nocardioides marmoriginsengisoli]RNL63769.1 M23 family metallopeptidase [Nocardioides marmoriginsengisoli]
MPIEITVSEPQEGSKFTYQRSGPSEVGKPQARLSFRYKITNKSTTEDVSITSIKLGGVAIDGFFKDPASSRKIAKNSSRTFQNAAGGTKDSAGKDIWWNDVVRLDKNTATSVDLSVTVKGSGAEETKTITIQLAEHTNDKGPFAFPGRVDFLGPNESFWTTNNHGSGHQVFALDVCATGWSGSSWNELHPAQASLPEAKQRREDYRIYGMPLFAMADGTVGFAVNDQPEWKTFDRVTEPQVDPVTKALTVVSPTFGIGYGSGNHLWVISGNETLQYAHLQKGSIPKELLTVGAQVKRGQYLGKVGWSGTTSRPHFHIAVKTKKPTTPTNDAANSNECDSGTFRPMSFSGTWTLPIKDAADPDGAPAAEWTKLANQSAPYEGSFMAHGDKPPAFAKSLTDKTPHVGIWHASNEIDLKVVRRGFAAFVKAYEQMHADKFTLIALESFVENGGPTFLGVFRRKQSAQFLSQVAPWEQFVADAATRVKAGMELRDVTSFLDGKTRWFVGVYVAGPNGGVPVRVDSVDLLNGAITTQRKSGRELIAMHTYAPAAGKSGPAIGVFATSADQTRLVVENNWDAFFKAAMALCTDNKRRLTDIVSWASSPSRQFAGIVRPDATKTGQLIGGHGTYSDFQRWSEIHAAGGWRLAQVHTQ